jgi:hypothetical protein
MRKRAVAYLELPQLTVGLRKQTPTKILPRFVRGALVTSPVCASLLSLFLHNFIFPSNDPTSCHAFRQWTSKESRLVLAIT